MAHNVLIHSCFDPVTCNPIQLGIGAWEKERSFVENPNRTCSCAKRISFHERDRKLDLGEAYVILKLNATGNRVPEWKEIVEVKTDRVPRAPTIERAHIERAYVGSAAHPYGDEQEQKRIEAYGELTQKSFTDLGAGLRDRGRITPPTEIAPTQPGESAAVINFRDDRSTQIGLQQRGYSYLANALDKLLEEIDERLPPDSIEEMSERRERLESYKPDLRAGLLGKKERLEIENAYNRLVEKNAPGLS